MFQKKLFRTLLALCLPMILSTACLEFEQLSDLDSSSDTSDEEELEEPSSLESDTYGDYSTDDEDVTFGLLNMEQFESDTEEEDVLIDETEENEVTDSGEFDAYWVRLVWGNLELDVGRGNDDDGSWLDWTGSLSIEGDGYLILKRTILFERHDSLLPRVNRQTLPWESYTGPHVDGILVKVLVPVDVDPETVTLTFSTDAYEGSLLVSELDRYNEIETIDNDGHGVAIAALKVSDDDCPAGFMQGKYYERSRRSGGIFRGRFVRHHGDLHGHLRGHFGENRAGEQVFFGKYIKDRGHFGGRLRGAYDNGSFDGTWHNRNNVHSGSIDGRYVTGTEVDSGFFQGLWEETCE